MKALASIMLLSGLVLFSSSTIFAQQTTPPSRVSVKFQAKYPQHAAKADWKQSGSEYTATFSEDGRRTLSRFGENGQWLGSETQVQEADWRPSTRQYMDENHQGYRFLQGYRFDDPKGSRYQIDVESKSGARYRLDFDGKGNFVNERPLQE